MKSILISSIVLASAAVTSARITLPNGWVKIPPEEKIESGEFNGEPRYLTWMADSQIKHGVEPTFACTVSVYLSGILLAYGRTGDDKYAQLRQTPCRHRTVPCLEWRDSASQQQQLYR